MKNKKKTAILYYLTSLLFYVVAATKFWTASGSTGVIWLCLGSTFLCLGASIQMKHKREKEKDTSNKD